MKATRWILIVLFAVSAIAAAAVSVTSLREASRIETSKSEKEQELEQTIAKLHEVGFKYRGFLESKKDVPDSMRTYGAGQLMEKEQKYQKQIFHLEREQREQKRLLKKDDRALAEIYGQFKRRLSILGGAALLFLVAAFIAGRAANRS